MYYVYILASQKNGTLLIKGFTQKYHIHLLVYYEQSQDINSAILREKRIKSWKRQWKIELIEKNNPNWLNLYGSLLSQG